MKNLLKEFRIALTATAALAILVCGIYPILVWAIAQGVFPAKANGSLIARGSEVAGSHLISQGFRHPKYFHPRPSSAGQGHDATASGGSNLGPTSRSLAETLKQRIVDYRTENGLTPEALIPADAVTASASGLDPHIGVKNARLQAPRVARMRGLSEKSVIQQVDVHTEGRDLGILGEERVNVVLLNMALDNLAK